MYLKIVLLHTGMADTYHMNHVLHSINVLKKPQICLFKLSLWYSESISKGSFQWYILQFSLEIVKLNRESKNESASEMSLVRPRNPMQDQSECKKEAVVYDN